MPRIQNPSPLQPPASQPPATQTPTPTDPDSPPTPSAPTPSQDLLKTQTQTPQSPNLPQWKIFDTEPPAPQATEKKGWQVKSVHLNMGYVLDNNVIHSGPMRIQNPEQGTDLTISNYQQVDRKNWEYLTIAKGQRFAPDEPQFNVGVNMTFANGFGVEVDAKHNKIIMDGYEQNVDFEGTFHGESLQGSAPLNTVMQQHEQTLGNLQLSALGTYTFDLPAPARHRFSLISKAGPSLITSNTRSQIRNAQGDFSGGTNSLECVGYGAMIENGLRYQFGPKVAQLGLELSHSLSYLNYANYHMVEGYTGSHTALYNSFALKATVGLSGNKK